jgi:hypothetical protein
MVGGTLLKRLAFKKGLIFEDVFLENKIKLR